MHLKMHACGALVGWLSRLERRPTHRKVVGLISGQGVYGRQPISVSLPHLSISLCSSLPFPLSKINNKTYPWVKIKKIHICGHVCGRWRVSVLAPRPSSVHTCAFMQLTLIHLHRRRLLNCFWIRKTVPLSRKQGFKEKKVRMTYS